MAGKGDKPMLRILPHIERAAHHIALALDQLPGLGVSQGEAHVLVYLGNHGASTVGRIHRAFGHRRSTLTSILDRLAARALVVRTVSEDDRRSFVVRLTPAGQRIAAKLDRYLEMVERDWAQRVTEADLKGFLNVVRAIADAPEPPPRRAAARSTKP